MQSVPTANVVHIGNSRQPVLVIDGFVSDPEALAGEAAALTFAPMGAHYPGVRAAVPTRSVVNFVKPVAALIAQTFGVSPDLGLIEAMYSLVTAAPADLRPIQRLPHFDGCEPERLALLHYLGGCKDGGTAFYRHRATGLEFVGPGQLAQYDAALRRDIAQFGIPADGYIAGDTPIFERIARFEGRYNRALVYRGQTLHCADLPGSSPLSPDPRKGRLTVNTFLMGKPA